MIRLVRFDAAGREVDRAQRIQPDTVPVIADILHQSNDGVETIVEDLTIHFKDGTRWVYSVVNERERRAPHPG